MKDKKIPIDVIIPNQGERVTNAIISFNSRVNEGYAKIRDVLIYRSDLYKLAYACTQIEGEHLEYLNYKRDMDIDMEA